MIFQSEKPKRPFEKLTELFNHKKDSKIETRQNK